MFKKNIDKVLKFLSIFPPLIIIILSIIITSYVYIENQKSFEKQQLELKKDYLNSHRLKIYTEVNKIYDLINKEYETSEEELKKDLKSRVDNAYSVIIGLLKNNSSLSKKEKIRLIKNALRNVRFNDERGYYYIYSMDGECILLPIAEQLEGSNFLKVKDVKGKYITQSIISSLKNKKEEFIKWWWFKPNDNKKQYEKISYNKYIEELDIYVGTGDYIQDLENKIKTRILNLINKLEYENSYIFVINYEGVALAHKNKKLINKGLLSLKNIDTNNIKNIVELAKINEGYITYKSDFFGSFDKVRYKTSYIKGFSKWSWAIGMGFNKYDLNLIIKEKEKALREKNRLFLGKIILISILVTLILITILYYNVKFIKKRFELVQEKIQEEIELNNQKDKLLFQQSKMASLGEMLQNIAHQWRQPLSIISTAASSIKLKKDYKMLDDKYIDESVNTIMKSSSYLSKTIDDFRDFLKSDKKEESFFIHRAIEDSFEILNVKFQKKNIVIIDEFLSHKYLGLKNELIQVFMNIFNNAIDAFEDEIEKKYIFVKIKEEKEELIIQIKDNAGGIDKQIIDRVFEPYFTTKHQTQGTGIGLFMSEEIITKHLKGKISVENSIYFFKGKEYKGAKFSIYLPIKEVI